MKQRERKPNMNERDLATALKMHYYAILKCITMPL